MGTVVEFPAGAPVIFNSIPRKVVAALCRKYVGQIPNSNDGSGNLIDVPRLLWALAGNESTFGDNCKPRHEPAYDVGGYYYERSQAVRDAVKKYGVDADGKARAACSYGPWQVMLINTHYTPEELASDPAKVADATVHYLSTYVVQFRKALTLAEILDTYNTGNWKDKNVPLKYIHDGVNYYQNFLLPPTS